MVTPEFNRDSVLGTADFFCKGQIAKFLDHHAGSLSVHTPSLEPSRHPSKPKSVGRRPTLAAATSVRPVPVTPNTEVSWQIQGVCRRLKYCRGWMCTRSQPWRLHAVTSPVPHGHAQVTRELSGGEPPSCLSGVGKEAETPKAALAWHCALLFPTGHHDVGAHRPDDGGDDLQPRRHAPVLQRPGGLRPRLPLVLAIFNHLHLVGNRMLLPILSFFSFLFYMAFFF